MGQMLNAREIISKNIDQHSERVTSQFTRYLNTKPTFVTYLRQNKLTSTEDSGLHDVTQIIGTDSPIRYDRIENVPIYGLEQLNVQIQAGEFGLDTDVSGDGTIIPDTLKPLSNDFFFIQDRLGKSYLFEINNVSNDRLDYGQFYKIEFSLSKIGDEANSIANQVDNEYTLLFENIGTKQQSVLQKDVYFANQYIKLLKDELIKKYEEYFYDPSSNSIILTKQNEHGELNIYDAFLTKFIIDNRLLERSSTFMNIIHLQLFFSTTKGFILSYEGTVYNKLEKNKWVDSTFNKIKYMPMRKASTPFEFIIGPYYQSFYTNCSDKSVRTLSEFLMFKPAFMLGVKFDNDKCYENIYEKLINDYFNNRFKDNSDLIEETLDAFNEMNYYPDETEYFFIPIVLFILNQLSKEMTYVLNK